MRALLVLGLLAGCSAPASGPAPTSGPADRAREAGLDPSAAARLTALGVPVAVPVVPDGWTLAEVEADPGLLDGLAFPRYRLLYRSGTGACLAVVGETEGLGDVFVEEPAQTREVAVPGLATYGPAVVGWGGPFGPMALTEWLGADGVAVGVRAVEDPGCTPASPSDVASWTGALRYLDPADDVLALGTFEAVEPPAEPASSPEAAVSEAYRPEAGGESGETAVTTLRRRARHAVVLMTTTGLPDDSVRDERLRVVVMRDGDAWVATEVGRQVRCQPGRGHAGWGAGRCL